MTTHIIFFLLGVILGIETTIVVQAFQAARQLEKRKKELLEEMATLAKIIDDLKEEESLMSPIQIKK